MKVRNRDAGVLTCPALSLMSFQTAVNMSTFRKHNRRKFPFLHKLMLNFENYFATPSKPEQNI